MSVTQSSSGRVSAYEVVHASREFQSLRRHFGDFVVPGILSFLAWYFLYVICAAFAPGFMSLRVIGEVNVGLCFGVLQFVMAFVIAMVHLRWGRRRFDVQSERLRLRLEEGRTR